MTDASASCAPSRLRAIARGVREVLGSPVAHPISWSALALGAPGLALAGPAGEQLIAGHADVRRPDAGTTLVDQTSQKAILNWQSFSIGRQELVQFRQPGSSAVALNRVVGGNPSSILGRLSADGRVFLVNPRGVYFGPGATVDVAGLVASVMDIRDEDFLAGRYVFTRAPGTPDGAGVVNDGVIRAREGGFVVLAGDYVRNNNVVSAQLGQVVLAAGSRMTLDVDAAGLVSFVVDEGTVADLAGVENTGELLADGGRVIMTAKVAGDLAAAAVNQEGLVQARSVVERDGEIWLAAEGGSIEVSGTVDASGEGGASGGTISITADAGIAVRESARIVARGDGDADGGEALLIAGGDLDVERDAVIRTDGGEDGGDGGFIELSGRGEVNVRGLGRTIRAGRGGEILFDPAVTTLVEGSSRSVAGANPVFQSSAEAVLGGGTDFGITASSQVTQSDGNGNRTSFTVAPDGAEGFGIGDLTITAGDGAEGGAVNLAGVKFDLRDDFASSNGAVNISISGDSGSVSVGSIHARQITINAGAAAGGVTIDNDPGGGTDLGDLAAEDIGGGPRTASVNVTGDGTLNVAKVSAEASGSIGESVNALIAIDMDDSVNASGIEATATSINPFGDATDATADIEVDAGDDVHVFGDVIATAFARGTRTGSSVFASGNATARVDMDADNIEILGDAIASARAEAVATGIDAATASVDASAEVELDASFDIDVERIVAEALGFPSATGASTSETADQNADVEVFAGNMVDVSGGDVYARTNPDFDGDADIDVTGSSGVDVGKGTVEALGRDGARVQFDGGEGGLSVQADVLATAGTAGTATIDMDAGTDAVFEGVLEAMGGGGASIDIDAGGSVEIGDDVLASICAEALPVATVSIDGSSGILVNGDITASQSITLHITGTGDISGPGLIGAPNPPDVAFTPSVGFTFSGGGDLDVKTNAKNVTIDYVDIDDNDVFVDNTAYEGTGADRAQLSFLGVGSSDDQAGDVGFAAGGDVLVVQDQPMVVANFNGAANGSLDMGGMDVEADQALGLTAGGDVTLSNTVLRAFDNMQIIAGGDIQNGPAFLDANAMLLVGKNILLDDPGSAIAVGNGSVPGVFGDQLVIDFLDDNGIGPAGPGVPNLAAITTGSTIALANLSLVSSSYLFFQGNQISLANAAAGADPSLVVQTSLPTPDTSQQIDVQDAESIPCLAGLCLGDDTWISKFPNTTMVVGSADQTGDIFIATDAPMDIDPKNLVCVTSGDCFDLGNVTTTGLLAHLIPFVEVPPEVPPEPPAPGVIVEPRESGQLLVPPGQVLGTVEDDEDGVTVVLGGGEEELEEGEYEFEEEPGLCS